MRHECWTSQGNVSFSPWKSVCHDWSSTDATHNCMPGCEDYISSYSKLVYLCGFCLYAIRSWKSHVWWFLGMKELVNLLQRFCVGRTGPIPWPGSSYEFTLLDSGFWDCVTKHNYIWPFGILLMERHTKIEHVLRPAVFWDCTQRRVVIPFWCFGITNRSHFQGSSCPRRTCLDSRQPARTGCLLEQLTVTELVWW